MQTEVMPTWFYLPWGVLRPLAGATSCPPATRAGRMDALEPVEHSILRIHTIGIFFSMHYRKSLLSCYS